MKDVQLAFDSQSAFKDHARRIEHGGGIRKGKRKLARPFDPSKSLHVTLRSSRARGPWSFMKLNHQKKINRALYSHAAKFHIKIYRFANAGNHLHILLKARSRKNLGRFLKTIGGLIPRLITNARKGRIVGQFWDELVYSKVVQWGKHFKNTSAYVVKNTLEAFGIIPPRSQSLDRVKLDYEGIFLEEFDMRP